MRVHHRWNDVRVRIQRAGDHFRDIGLIERHVVKGERLTERIDDTGLIDLIEQFEHGFFGELFGDGDGRCVAFACAWYGTAFCRYHTAVLRLRCQR